MDTETLGLDQDAPVWEFAAIRRDSDGIEVATHIFIRHEPEPWLSNFPSPFRDDYLTRYDHDIAFDEHAAAEHIYDFMRDTTIVGAVPDFDTTRLTPILVRAGLSAVTIRERLELEAATSRRHPLPWHYHCLDVENAALGYLAGKGQRVPRPWTSDDLSTRLGVNPADYTRHTAMGDVQWIRAQHDAMFEALP
ncbi:hypothetical protein H7H98_08110 [Mycolicibacterium sphagni]|nr:hypothetical protein [Mycolicibacterium sphagni]